MHIPVMLPESGRGGMACGRAIAGGELEDSVTFLRAGLIGISGGSDAKVDDNAVAGG